MCYWFTFFIKYMVFCSEMNTGGRGEAVVRACDSHQFGLGSGLAMNTIYELGTSQYLSPGGRRILGGSLNFWEEKKRDQS